MCRLAKPNLDTSIDTGAGPHLVHVSVTLTFEVPEGRPNMPVQWVWDKLIGSLWPCDRPDFEVGEAKVEADRCLLLHIAPPPLHHCMPSWLAVDGDGVRLLRHHEQILAPDGLRQRDSVPQVRLHPARPDRAALPGVRGEDMRALLPELHGLPRITRLRLFLGAWSHATAHWWVSGTTLILTGMLIAITLLLSRSNVPIGQRGLIRGAMQLVLAMWILFGAFVRRSDMRAFLRKRLRAGGIDICTACGYSLTDNVSGVWPECGMDVLSATDAPAR